MDREVELPGGDRVAYAIYGREDGRPVLLLHGFSDSRLTGRAFEAAARRTGVRLIVPDRPGIGGSTGSFESLADVAGWLSELADVLGLPRVPVVGISGGGPFTLAAARFAPQRVERAVVVSGLGPPELGYAEMPAGQRLSIAVASRAPALAGRVLGLVARLGRVSPALFLRLVGSSPSPADAEAVRDPGSVETIVRPFVEAYRQGSAGVAGELRLLLRPWGFAPAEVSVPVRFEHGADDATVPPAAARALARAVPGGRLSIRDGVGHFTIVPRYGDELLRAALGEA
ncbi:MAG TPA: alpha/beta hydrolase [Gaiellaceae bacterium]|nr:alpha/beta hydrolase [Gaiellaceae bacterium]